MSLLHDSSHMMNDSKPLLPAERGTSFSTFPLHADAIQTVLSFLNCQEYMMASIISRPFHDVVYHRPNMTGGFLLRLSTKEQLESLLLSPTKKHVTAMGRSPILRLAVGLVERSPLDERVTQLSNGAARALREIFHRYASVKREKSKNEDDEPSDAAQTERVMTVDDMRRYILSCLAPGPPSAVQRVQGVFARFGGETATHFNVDNFLAFYLDACGDRPDNIWADFAHQGYCRELEHVPLLTTETFQGILAQMPQLTRLDELLMISLTQLPEEHLTPHRLQSLTLTMYTIALENEGGEISTANALQTIVATCSSLTHLDLILPPGIGGVMFHEDAFHPLIPLAPTLRTLRLGADPTISLQNYTAKQYRDISQLYNLTTLFLRECRWTAYSLSCFSAHGSASKTLQELIFHDSIDDTALIVLASKFPALTRLIPYTFAVTDISPLANMTNLTQLHVFGNNLKHFGDQTPAVSGAQWSQALRPLVNMRDLALHDIECSSDDLAHAVENMVVLEELWIAGLILKDFTFLRPLAQTLREFECNRCRFPGRGETLAEEHLRVISCLRKLRSLHLCDTLSIPAHMLQRMNLDHVEFDSAAWPCLDRFTYESSERFGLPIDRVDDLHEDEDEVDGAVDENAMEGAEANAAPTLPVVVD